MSTPQRPDDETSQRFREIMDAEFGADEKRFSAPPTPDELARRERIRRPVRRPENTLPESHPPEVPEQPFNLSEAMSRASPDEPDEPFEPPQPAPLPRPTGRVLLGSICLSVGILLGLAGLLGAPLGQLGAPLGLYWGRWAVGSFGVGLAILLFSLPRTPRDPDNDGARV